MKKSPVSASVRSDEPAPPPQWSRVLESCSETLALYVINLDGRILDANGHFFAMTGYSRDDLPSLRWTDLMAPESRALGARMLCECAERGHTPPFEKAYIHRDGSRIPALLFADILESGTASGDAIYLVHAVDLRFVARGQSAVLESVEPPPERAPHFVWRSDAAGRNVYFNDAWYTHTGLSAEELRGEHWTKPLHPDDVEAVHAAWRRAIRKGTAPAVQFRVRSAAGVYQWFVSSATVLRDDGGRVTQFHGTLANIDVQKRLERQSAISAAVSTAVVNARTLSETLDAIVSALVASGLAEWATISLIEEDRTLRVKAVYHSDPAKRLALEGLTGWRPVTAAPHSEQPRLTGSPHESPIFHEVAALFDEVGYASAIAVPLMLDGANAGTLKVVRSSARPRYVETDVPFVQNTADGAAAAIASARLHERERRIATTFQNAVLPQSLPRVPGIRFDALYAAGQAEALVGGDWYDAYRLPDGRCVISIGDVSGSGLHAATLMAEARQTMRGAASVNPDPVLMLAAADRVVSEREGSRFATAWVGVIDPADLTLVYAGAGHPAPVLRGADGTVTRLNADGLPLGLRELTDDSPNVARQLAPGAQIVLFTDGLTEYDRDLLAAERALEALVAPRPVTTAHDVMTSLLHGRSAHDDVAILLVSIDRRLSDTGLDSVVEWHLDASRPAAARSLRVEVSRELRSSGMAPDDVAVADLICAELIANVVQHAPGSVRVILDWSAAKPVLHVIDRGPGFAFNTRLPADALSEHGRGLYIVAQLCAGFNVSPNVDGGSHARAVLPVRNRPHGASGLM